MLYRASTQHAIKEDQCGRLKQTLKVTAKSMAGISNVSGKTNCIPWTKMPRFYGPVSIAMKIQ